MGSLHESLTFVCVLTAKESRANNWPSKMHLSPVALVSAKAPVSVNVDNNGRDRCRYCQRVYNNGTVSVNVDSNAILLTFTLTGVWGDNMCDINAYC